MVATYIGVAVVLALKNSARAYWLNLCVAGWADAIRVLIVVLPGCVSLAPGLIPPAIFAAAQRLSREVTGSTSTDNLKA